MSTPSYFAALMLGLVFVGLLILPALLILHAFMPKAILDRYWKHPYFRPTELELFTDTIYAPMRTVMFMWLILFPRAGRKRKIENVRSLAPAWYRVASIGVALWVLITVLGLVSLAIGFDVYWATTGSS